MTMDELARFAADEQMIPKAAVQAARSIKIIAPLGKVWSTLTEVWEWERWHPYLKDVKLECAFSGGSHLTYGGFIKHKLRIAKVIPGKLVILYGSMAGYKGITRWEVKQATGTETEVSFTESSSGFMIGTLYSNQKLGQHLQRWLKALKAEAERSA